MIPILNNVAIAGASGTFKGVFVHGVLTAFERQGFFANAYGGASSSTLACSAAVSRMSEEVGLGYWRGALAKLNETEGNLSEVVLDSIRRYAPLFRSKVFLDGAARLVISTSRVKNDAAAVETQGPAARKLGKRLLLSALRKNDEWVLENLQPWLFDTQASSDEYRLTADNYDEVAYATTRMLHAWDIPATVKGVPFVDASYTSACPADELFALGYETVIAISPVPGPVYTNIFQTRVIGETSRPENLHIISPDVDPKEFGVDFTTATEAGLQLVYEQGIKKGNQFLGEDYWVEMQRR